MADNTKIEWTDATVNFWRGCTKVGPGCDHCYAETWSKRTGENIWGRGVPRRKIKSAVSTIYRLHNGASWWAADCHIGKLHDNPRRRVFVQSMSDLFDREVPDDWFDEAWGAITACDALDIQIVTKRLPNIEKRLDGRPWPKHAGLIISIVNQEEADRDIPRLIALKAKLGIPWIGLSMEPLLGEVVLRPVWLAELGWIIVGGESGPGARPMHPDWKRSLRDQCANAGVPFLFKQHGEWLGGRWHGDGEIITFSSPDITDEGVRVINRLSKRDAAKNDDAFWSALHTWDDDTMPNGEGPAAFKVGKKAAGRLLDGVEHNGFPEVAHG